MEAEVAGLKSQLMRLLPAAVPLPKAGKAEQHRDRTTTGKRSTRRKMLTQLAVGAAGVAAAAVYNTTMTGTASAEFIGTVIGPSNSQSGIYAYPNGVAPIGATGTAGVWGQADNNAPDPGSHVRAGVIGIGNANMGVVGQSIFSAGVSGRSNNSQGVAGTSFSFYGVSGISTNSSGVVGQTSSSSSGEAGVLGYSGHAASVGVRGENGSTGGIGVRGIADTGASARGVYGSTTSGTGVWGHSITHVGLKGTSVAFVGLVGISDQNIGLYGYTAAPGVPAFYSENVAASNRIAGRFVGDVQVIGNFSVSGGAKNAAVKLPDGSEALVYCQESTEPFFEDFGRANLTAGVARVGLEPQFANIVHREGHMVFVTPGGDSKGLYVSRRDASGFEVRELKGGASTLPFTYRVVAKRKDIPGERLKKVEPHKTTESAINLQKTLRDKGLTSMQPPDPPSPPGRPQDPGQAGPGTPRPGPR